MTTPENGNGRNSDQERGRQTKKFNATKANYQRVDGVVKEVLQ